MPVYELKRLYLSMAGSELPVSCASCVTQAKTGTVVSDTKTNLSLPALDRSVGTRHHNLRSAEDHLRLRRCPVPASIAACKSLFMAATRPESVKLDTCHSKCHWPSRAPKQYSVSIVSIKLKTGCSLRHARVSSPVKHDKQTCAANLKAASTGFAPATSVSR